jgi:ABC-type sugar transport system permease subunit
MAIAVGRTKERRRLSKAFSGPGQKEALWGMLCVAPAVIGFVAWYLGPMIASLGLAFTDYQVAGGADWVGLDNFHTMFVSDRLFRKALRVTATYSLMSVPLRVIVAFLLAMLLNQKLRGSSIFRAIFYLPSIVPLIASSVVWLWMFNPDFGLLNGFLRDLGLERQRWTYSSDTVLQSLTMMSLWDVGPMMIIFLAGLQGVPRQLYDAVSVDGGTAWNRFISVTVPMTTPTILFNLVLSVIAAFQTFVQAFIMTDGGPNNNSLFYGFYLYRKAFEDGDMGYASALGWVLFVIIAILSVIIFRSSSRWVYYEGGS